MVRRPSTGKNLQGSKNELTSSRNAIHKGFKEKYFSLCFSFALLVGFASLQKNSVVLIPKIGEVKLFSINSRHSLFKHTFKHMLWNSVHTEYRKSSHFYTIFHIYFHWFSWNEHAYDNNFLKIIKICSFPLCMCSSPGHLFGGPWWLMTPKPYLAAWCISSFKVRRKVGIKG